MKTILVLTFLLTASSSAQRFEFFPFRPPPPPVPVHPSFYERVGRVMFDAVNDFKFSFEREMKKLNCSSVDAEKPSSSSNPIDDATFSFNLKDNCMVFTVKGKPVYKYCSSETARIVFRDADNFIPDFSHVQPIFVPFVPMERKEWEVEVPVNDFPFIPNEFLRDNHHPFTLPPVPDFNRPELSSSPSWNHEIRHASSAASENIKTGWLRDLLFRRSSSFQHSPPEMISEEFVAPQELRLIQHNHLPPL